MAFKISLWNSGTLSLCLIGSFTFQESCLMEDMIDVVVNDVFCPVLDSFL